MVKGSGPSLAKSNLQFSADKLQFSSMVPNEYGAAEWRQRDYGYEDYHVPPAPDQQQWGGPYPHYQYAAHMPARAPVPTYQQPAPQEPSRRLGQWTREEEAYAEKVAALFKTGRVPNCPEGLTMRALLADLLNCAPMRVSKKFSGERAIGKCSYKRVQDDLSKEEADLKPLEEAFHRSLRGVGHLKMSLAHTSNLITPIEAARNPHRVDMVSQNDQKQQPMQPAMPPYHPYMQDHRGMPSYQHYARSPPRPMVPTMGRPSDGAPWGPPGAPPPPPPGAGYAPSADPHVMGGPPPGYMGHPPSSQPPAYARPPLLPHGGADDRPTSAAPMPPGAAHGHPSYVATHAPTSPETYQSGAHEAPPPGSMRPAKMARYHHTPGPPPPPPQHARPPPQHPSAYPTPPAENRWAAPYQDDRPAPEQQPVDPAVRYD